MRILNFCLLLLLLNLKFQAATRTVVASGNWSLTSTWSSSSIPSCNDIIVIPAGYTVTINTTVDLTVGGCNGTRVDIYGTLFFSGNSSRLDVVSSSTINIYAPNGKITTDQPNNNSQKINIGNGPSEWTSSDGSLSGPWTITNGSSSTNPTLPIELIEFKGTCSTNGTQLEWSTASERINDYFIVEKSLNAMDWQLVAKVSGNGTTNTLHKYSHNDDAGSGLMYYRLSQVDKTGDKTIFKIIDVNCKNASTNQMIISPNPASTELKVSIKFSTPPANQFMKIFNAMGELVFETIIDLTEGPRMVVLPTELNNGTYSVTLTSENFSLNQKLVILK